MTTLPTHQLSLLLPKDVEAIMLARAEKEGMSIEEYLMSVLKKQALDLLEKGRDGDVCGD